MTEASIQIRGKHVENRLRIIEGFSEGSKCLLVTVEQNLLFEIIL